MALLLAKSAPAPAAQTIVLTTLEWPPYVGKALPQQGGSAAVVRAALHAVGVEVRFKFVPWPRAVQLGTYGKDYAGYFPAYFEEERSRAALISKPIGSSPLGLARQATRNLPWNSLDDLVHYRIGVVEGYVNTAEFDRRVGEGLLPADAAQTDSLNLLKLANRRIDFAVIDRHVFGYLLRTDPTLQPFAAQLAFDKALLEDKPLYVYFRRGPEGEQLRALFNQGLEKIRAEELFQRAVEGK
jgi:polar amino acid transport system substrate-binding protein